MKKIKLLNPIIVCLLSTLCFSCADDEEINNGLKEDVLLAENYETIKNLSEITPDSSFTAMYDEELFGRFSNIKHQELYKNNILDNSLKDGQIGENDDAKYLYYNDDHMRFVNRSDGYAFNLKTDTTMVGDFSVAACRNRLYNVDTTLAVSKETKNPYSSWTTYRDEWLIRYINNPEYLKDNDMTYTSPTVLESSMILPNYNVSLFSILINDAGKLRKMYYNIGVVKSSYDLRGKEFYLFVMKSTYDRTDDFKEMIQSFEVLNSTKGISQNHLQNMENKYNPNWSDETKAYYDSLCSEQKTAWGVYVSNIDRPSDINNKTKDLENAMDYEFGLTPTYQHLLSGNKRGEFNVSGANATAGGNGFNGKKVLQFTFQYTNNNNHVTVENTNDCYTPMFDILRGPRETDIFNDRRNNIDMTFTNIANGLKEYGKPVLFRLNNEMNTDWTSYCGMMTLLDPDIFQATWRYLYNFLMENGVNNTIWIFNPMAESCPASSWSEDMSYFPGNDYVQALGLTYYESNNDNGDINLRTFRKDYTYLYDKNNDTWNKYPWIISEFGCGSGGSASGEAYRNQDKQVLYVAGMFEDFAHRENNKYLQNIKGAVWFSVNDYSDGGVSNMYSLEITALPDTIEEFKKGFAKLPK